MREKLGYTQVALAKKAGLSLRTIQRLESSNEKPKGHTLTRLSDVFAIEPSSLQDQFNRIEHTKESERTSIQLINLSILAFFGIPFGNIILPVLLWRRKRQSELVNEMGRRIINFQILWSAILCLLLCISPFINKIFLSDTPLILVVLFSAMAINIIIVCYTAIKLQHHDFHFLNVPIRLI